MKVSFVQPYIGIVPDYQLSSAHAATQGRKLCPLQRMRPHSRILFLIRSFPERPFPVRFPHSLSFVSFFASELSFFSFCVSFFSLSFLSPFFDFVAFRSPELVWLFNGSSSPGVCCVGGPT